jgi:hypothetical protein
MAGRGLQYNLFPRLASGAWRLPRATASSRVRLGHDRHYDVVSPRSTLRTQVQASTANHAQATSRSHVGPRPRDEEESRPRAADNAASPARLDTRPSGALAPGYGSRISSHPEPDTQGNDSHRIASPNRDLLSNVGNHARLYNRASEHLLQITAAGVRQALRRRAGMTPAPSDDISGTYSPETRWD